MQKITSIGIAGATGYAGQELIKLAARHPGIEITAAMGSEGTGGVRHIPALSRLWEGEITPLSIEQLASKAEAVFLALPETVAATIGPELIARGVRVFDLSGAFRLQNPQQRTRWYPATPAFTEPAVYGLTELNRTALIGARLIACPGCYPTAALLALRPLYDAQLLDGDIIIDAKSGVSGAGKTPSERTHFSECYGNAAAYGVFAHRHGAEIEQELQTTVTFTPHLIPLDRGILATIYVRIKRETTEADVIAALESTYRECPFVRLTGDTLPEIKHVVHTNFCDIGWKIDIDSGRLILVACLDNLVKGAAGQAIQNLNISFGLDETIGLL
jgi:N-acetyl-gamma-glutamyl-phosphate reductase